MHTVFAGLKEFQPEMTKRPTAMGQPAFQSWPELNGQLGFWLANTSVCFLYTYFCNKYVKTRTNTSQLSLYILIFPIASYFSIHQPNVT